MAVSAKAYPTPSVIPGFVPKGQEKDWLNNNGHRDAFRHALWSALLVKEFGAKWSGQFATAHEALPGNDETREAMDLYNNEVGRGIATSNLRATDAELAALIGKADAAGELVVIDGAGNLAWSNTVPPWTHGFASSKTRPGAIPVPAGDASANTAS